MQPRIPSLLAILMTAAALVVLGPSQAFQGDAPAESPQAPHVVSRAEGGVTDDVRLTVVAPADVRALEAQVDATGELELPTDGHPLVLSLREVEVVRPEARVVRATGPDGAYVEVGRVTARTFQGRVAGDDASTAAITIDSAHGLVLGMVVTGGRVLDVVTQAQDDGTVLVGTSWTVGPLGIPSLGDVGDRFLAPAGPLPTHYEYLGANADASYRTFRGSSWTTYVTNQVNAQWGLWDAVSIRMQIGYFHETGANWGGNCGDNLNGLYGNLGARATWAHIHQLFSGNELNGLGCSWGGNEFGTSSNVGAIEARDHWPFDGYNPDSSTTEYAIVAGHEAGHQNYNEGEPYHPTTRSCLYWWPYGSCGDWEYNVMCCPETGYSNVQPDDQGLWWPTNYQTDIQGDAYYRL